jgi:hypothetical protein
MGSKMVINCDVCGRTKREVNHWWKTWIDNELFCCSAADNTREVVTNEVGEAIVVSDACGRECAQQLFNRFMTNGTLEAPAPEPVPVPVPVQANPPTSENDIPF